ncbi:hypothetical protein GIB67_036707 [Kingdonia uniflora]|uniref:Myb/SANT-like DNA-binding domain-containing protein n=1 Tax=Kingdonia uniflora TaxID=39325 RepID=A0A7J7LWQ9_9MAGN|nr:hypothetical protein GIB67_036707 [Kingdonia uniflora]
MKSNNSVNTYSGGGGGREDCWSEEASATLIEAWGDRYLQLNRGNLRQKDWKEVSDVVNDRHDDGVKPRRSDVQCKNRIDTIKKKYKLEKSKTGPSEWRFYDRLDYLIGTTPTAMKITPPLPVPPPLKSAMVTFTVKSRKDPPAVVYSGGSSSKSRLNSLAGGSTESSDEDDDDDMGFDAGLRKCRKVDVELNDDGAAFKELATAIVKFGETYERIESAKQQQIMELERQRMEFIKDLEFKRMQMFMEAQLDLAKMKRSKYSSATGKF